MATVATDPLRSAWLRSPHLLTLAGAALFVAVAFPVRALVQSSLSSKRLQEILPRARAAGIPLKASEVHRSVAASENAAPILRHAFAELNRINLDWTVFQPVKGERDYHIVLARPQAKQAMAKAEPVLSLIRQASAMPHCDFDKDPDQAPFLVFPELSDLKKLCKLAAFSGYMKSAAGDTEGAIADLGAAAGIARLAADGESLIAGLVAVACDSIYLLGVERSVAKARDEADINRYVALLDSFSLHIRADQYVKAEAYFQIVMARNAHLLKQKEPDGAYEIPAGKRLDNSEFPANPKDRTALVAVLKLWTPLFEELRDAQGNDKLVEAALMRHEDRAEKSIAPIPELGQIIGPGFLKESCQIWDKDLAQQRSTLGLAKALAYKARTGRLPTSLGEFAPGLTDPFGNQPIRYIKTEDGFRVYSVGKDGVDNNGLRLAEMNALLGGQEGEKSFDLAASYPPYGTMKHAAKG